MSLKVWLSVLQVVPKSLSTMLSLSKSSRHASSRRAPAPCENMRMKTIHHFEKEEEKERDFGTT